MRTTTRTAFFLSKIAVYFPSAQKMTPGDFSDVKHTYFSDEKREREKERREREKEREKRELEREA